MAAAARVPAPRRPPHSAARVHIAGGRRARGAGQRGAGPRHQVCSKSVRPGRAGLWSWLGRAGGRALAAGSQPAPTPPRHAPGTAPPRPAPPPAGAVCCGRDRGSAPRLLPQPRLVPPARAGGVLGLGTKRGSPERGWGGDEVPPGEPCGCSPPPRPCVPAP